MHSSGFFDLQKLKWKCIYEYLTWGGDAQIIQNWRGVASRISDFIWEQKDKTKKRITSIVGWPGDAYAVRIILRVLQCFRECLTGNKQDNSKNSRWKIVWQKQQVWDDQMTTRGLSEGRNARRTGDVIDTSKSWRVCANLICKKKLSEGVPQVRFGSRCNSRWWMNEPFPRGTLHGAYNYFIIF